MDHKAIAQAAGFRVSLAAVAGDEWNYIGPDWDPQTWEATRRGGFKSKAAAWRAAAKAATTAKRKTSEE